MTTPAIDPRQAYHAVRRAMTGHYVADGRHVAYARAASLAHGETLARAALLAALGAEKLPRGAGDAPRRLAAAVLGRARAEPPTIEQRAREHRRRRYLAEAERRGLPTILDLAKAGTRRLELVSETRTPEGHRVGLLRAEGWAEYSRRVGSYRASLALLCGRDDAGLWAVRVPGTIGGAEEGLEWLEPAAVRRARAEGRRVLRQGDVYVVERARDGMARADLPAGHRWDAAARALVHDEHAHLPVPFPATVFRQSTLAASGSRRRRGD